jgi:ribonucleotide monophosphatase NagD (HAD superfamily)
MWFFVMLSLLLLASTNDAVGASIYYIQPVKSIDDYYMLQFEGNIESGDYDKIVKIIKNNPDKFISNRDVVINSNGGNIIEAVKIGELFKKLIGH